MNVSSWIKDVIANPKRMAIPIMTHPGIDLIGKTVKDAVTDGKIHYEAIKALNSKYPSAAATVIMDLTVEAEAFGANVVFSDHEVPSVVGRLVSNMEEVKNLQVPSLDKGRVSAYLLANKLSAENIKDKPVFGGCIGPYSLAGRLFDMTEIMMAIYTDPEVIVLLLEKCTAFLMEYCKAIKATGVAGVIMAEPAAGLLSNSDSTEYSSKYVKQIVDAVQDDTFAVVLHNCGNSGHSTDAMVSTGAAGFHFGNKINMVEALEECPKTALVMGNLDPVSVFKQSTIAQVKKATLDLLEATRSFPNFILSSGCDVPPAVPLENIDAFYEALAEYNANL
jgi:uroporphyrinogen decarboxylase